MAGWTNIEKNLRNHGNFAGHSETEQDAYFEFFAGSDYGSLSQPRATLREAIRRLMSGLPKGCLHTGSAGLTSAKAANR